MPIKAGGGAKRNAHMIICAVDANRVCPAFDARAIAGQLMHVQSDEHSMLLQSVMPSSNSKC